MPRILTRSPVLDFIALEKAVAKGDFASAAKAAEALRLGGVVVRYVRPGFEHSAEAEAGGPFDSELVAPHTTGQLAAREAVPC